MAYEKQTWANGDLITAEKLNHMEDGIDESSLIEDFKITLTTDSVASYANPVVDKSFSEIKDAYDSGKKVIVEFQYTAAMNFNTIAKMQLTSVDKNRDTGEAAGFYFENSYMISSSVIKHFRLVINSFGTFLDVKDLSIASS